MPPRDHCRLLAIGGLLIRPLARDIARCVETRRAVDGLGARVDGLMLAISEALPHIRPRSGEQALLRLLGPTLAAERASGNPLTRDELLAMERYESILDGAC